MSVKRIKRNSFVRFNREHKFSIEISRIDEKEFPKMGIRNLGIFCDNLDLNVSKLYEAIKDAERRGLKYCDFEGWRFSWSYLNDFRELCDKYNISLTERMKDFHGSVNIESKRKHDKDLLDSINNAMSSLNINK